MKRVPFLSMSFFLLASFNGAAFAAAETASPPAKPAGDAGTTLVGDRDSAVGLYLLPWKEEAPSDIDRPPMKFDVASEPVDPTQFAARTKLSDDNAAFRRVRLEPRF